MSETDCVKEIVCELDRFRVVKHTEGEQFAYFIEHNFTDRMGVESWRLDSEIENGNGFVPCSRAMLIDLFILFEELKAAVSEKERRRENLIVPVGRKKLRLCSKHFQDWKWSETWEEYVARAEACNDCVEIKEGDS
ncbi:MAG: hypothetical protein K2X27_06690 [Candidatus Obscuribacterales bacterium]|nr:hypothetical protein [Candidatus Obscuribacterales bacterium]